MKGKFNKEMSTGCYGRPECDEDQKLETDYFVQKKVKTNRNGGQVSPWGVVLDGKVKAFNTIIQDAIMFLIDI